MEDYTGYSLEALVDVCRASGSAGAWNEFVVRTERLIFATVRSAVQRWRLPDWVIPDLVQETYLKISSNHAETLKGFESRHEFAILGYLRATAISVAHDFRKREATRKRGGGAQRLDVNELDPPAGAGAPGGPASIENAIVLNQIERILAALPRDYHSQRDHQIFWLYYRQGLTASAIAGIPCMSLTVKGVEAVIGRLTRLVRSKLKQDASSNAALSKGIRTEKSF